MANNNNDKFNLNPSFSKEDVYTLDCKYCYSSVCDRGMKSFLIADETIELYSTDQVDRCLVDLTDEKFRTDKCRCLIQNMACLQCGNVVGYHVAMPCRPCVKAVNNGHYWMFYRKCTNPYVRLNLQGTAILVWGDLATLGHDSFSDVFWEECER